MYTYRHTAYQKLHWGRGRLKFGNPPKSRVQFFLFIIIPTHTVSKMEPLITICTSEANIHNSKFGSATAQAVSHWLPTEAARVWSNGICDGQSGAGSGFLRALRFPLPIFILHPHNLHPHNHLGQVQ
jgi:hypothetical protein